MVMTEKKSENTSKIDLIGKLRSKYAIPANAPLGLTLIELGVDSFSFLEIQQDIETEIGAQIDLEVLKIMTLQNINELLKSGFFSKSSTLDEASKKRSKLENLFQAKIIKINNIEMEARDGNCILLIPGIDGITTNFHFSIAKHYKLPTFAIQYFHTYDCESLQQIADFVYEVRLLCLNKIFIHICDFGYSRSSRNNFWQGRLCIMNE
jgi:acyl carrier protein